MPRQSSVRLARLVSSSGSVADIPCLACLQHGRPCITASYSRRCSHCLLLNQGCSLARGSLSDSLDRDSSRLVQEIAVRSALESHLRGVLRCLSILERLSRSGSDLSDPAGCETE